MGTFEIPKVKLGFEKNDFLSHLNPLMPSGSAHLLFVLVVSIFNTDIKFFTFYKFCNEREIKRKGCEPAFMCKVIINERSF